MKRFHVHVNVDQLGRSIQFYSTLFGTAPSVVKADYAKWMLDDPRINFAISERGRQPGIDHLGLQAELADELDAIGKRLRSAGALALAEKQITCCYARSDKFRAEDPQGVRWESFLTHGEATAYSPGPDDAKGDPCCGAPSVGKASSTCGPTAAGCC